MTRKKPGITRYSDFKTPKAIKEMIRKATPKILFPETVTNLASCMTRSAKGRAIVKGLVTVGTEEALIISTDSMINRLNTAEKIVINRITNVLPGAVNDEMLMIHVAERRNNLTLTFGSVFVYSRERSIDLYKQTLTHIIELAAGLKDVQSVVTTADNATVKAIRAVLHPPTIRILWLDFVQSVCELWNSFSMENPPLSIIHYCWALGFCTDKEVIRTGFEEITKMVDKNISNHPAAAIFLSKFRNNWEQRMESIVLPREAFFLSQRSEALGRLIVSKLKKADTVPKLIDAMSRILNHEETRMNAFVNNDKNAPRDKTVSLIIQADHNKLQEHIMLLATRISVPNFFHMVFRPEFLQKMDHMILTKYHDQRSLFDVQDTQTLSTDVVIDQCELELSRLRKRPLEDDPSHLTDAVSELTGGRGHVAKFPKRAMTVGVTTNSSHETLSQAQIDDDEGDDGYGEPAVNSSQLTDDFPPFGDMLRGDGMYQDEPEDDLWDFSATGTMEETTESAYFPVHTSREDEELRDNIELSDSGFQEREEIAHDLDVLDYLIKDGTIELFPLPEFLNVPE